MRRFAILSPFILATLITACQPAPTPTPQSQGFDATATIALSGVPTVTLPAPALTSNPGTAIKPVLVSDVEIINPVWSPDGKWLAYTTYRESRVDFLNIESGEICASPVQGDREPHSFRHYWSWLADSRILEVNGGALIYAPCKRDEGEIILGLEDAGWIEAESPDRRVILLGSDIGFSLYNNETGITYPIKNTIDATETFASWSPMGTYVALYGPMDGDIDRAAYARLWLIDAATGAVVDQVDWTPVPMPFSYNVGWVDNQRYVIDTADRGPLLLTVNGDVKAIVQELFKRKCVGYPDCGSLLDPLPRQPDGAFHLILWDEAEHLIYHSDLDAVETIKAHEYFFSPDGAWLIQWGPESAPHIFRPIDASSNDAISIQMPEGVNDYNCKWSPDGTQLAVIAVGVLLVYDIPGGQLIEQYYSDAEPLSTTDLAWSPDGRRLAVTSVGRGRLFIINVP
jgi:WD40 repeat protein